MACVTKDRKQEC